MALYPYKERRKRVGSAVIVLLGTLFLFAFFGSSTLYDHRPFVEAIPLWLWLMLPVEAVSLMIYVRGGKEQA